MKYSQVQLIRETIKHKGFIGKIPALWRMLRAWKRGIYNASYWRIILPLLGLFYVISPLDFLPEIAIPFVGVVDDLLVLSLAIPKLIKEVDKFLLWEKLNQQSLSKKVIPK